MTENRIKVRDIAPTAIRLPPELRHALAREAAINGRSLHGEIVHRLKLSLESGIADQTSEVEALPPWSARADSERTLLTLFRRISPEKQLALLTLLR